jgi:hypothetical protein
MFVFTGNASKHDLAREPDEVSEKVMVFTGNDDSCLLSKKFELFNLKLIFLSGTK